MGRGTVPTHRRATDNFNATEMPDFYAESALVGNPAAGPQTPCQFQQRGVVTAPTFMPTGTVPASHGSTFALLKESATWHGGEVNRRSN
jgi:hypothetical protein